MHHYLLHCKHTFSTMRWSGLLSKKQFGSELLYYASTPSRERCRASDCLSYSKRDRIIKSKGHWEYIAMSSANGRPIAMENIVVGYILDGLTQGQPTPLNRLLNSFLPLPSCCGNSGGNPKTPLVRVWLATNASGLGGPKLTTVKSCGL
jgi:hypothetical protein